jgi:hypothetical protein
MATLTLQRSNKTSHSLSVEAGNVSDPGVATLVQNFHGLSMEAGNVSNIGDAQVQALQHGISSMKLSQ